MIIHLIRGYKRHGKTFFSKQLQEKLNVKIASFADFLKKQVYDALSIKGEISHFEKDEILPLHFQEDGCKTLRDFFKKFAIESRKEDPFFYAKKLIENNNYPEIIIDDFRFQDELKYLDKPENKLYFYRVFDNKGKIPEESDISEHDLDGLSFENEILILRN